MRRGKQKANRTHASLWRSGQTKRMGRVVAQSNDVLMPDNSPILAKIDTFSVGQVLADETEMTGYSGGGGVFGSLGFG